MENRFKERFSELIKASGFRQVDIAVDLNVNKQQITKWKTGYTEPNMNDIIMLADYFNVTTDYLLGKTDDFS